MTTNNLNNFSSDVCGSNFQTAATQVYDAHTYNNNANSSISGQQPLPNNNVNYFPDNNTSLNHNHQQQYDSHSNYQQYIQQPGNNVTITPDHNLHHNYHQPMSNVASNSNPTSDASNTIPHYNNQQSTSNNISPPQFYHDQNQQNSLQSNTLPSLNPFGININSPQAPIIIINSDIQNQLQQVLAYLK
ncbi:hypothetical protein RclHR1_01610019 [Rhizophagus clarus]|uniref:Uncharacterized protein n=1 Tax=Rhizophagus clarus TaxID=94130 RepID=A0A2Z6R9P2_9GLOM|nr:hypothetical protein RclHR1_01610019 [Rhizophagus clarus]GES98071.1 hypothetical protein GLOIN_2v1880782 [Rhizophagus clarus]